jgi:hypothetical protein
MGELLMKKATAVWLIENTSLTFDQIATFCSLHPLEIQTLADQENGSPAVSIDPVTTGQISWEEIERCQKDPNTTLVLNTLTYDIKKKNKIKRYTPLLKRHDRPDAIAWFIKYYPSMTDQTIMSFLGTTKKTIESIRKKNHWNMENIKAKSPVAIGFCSQQELDELLEPLEKMKKEGSEE